MASWQQCELMAIWQQCELMAAGHGSSDLSSCEKGEQWQLALALLNEMWEANSLEPDVIRVIRQGLGRARRRPGRVRDVGGEAGARRHQPRHWPRDAQAWPRETLSGWTAENQEHDETVSGWTAQERAAAGPAQAED